MPLPKELHLSKFLRNVKNKFDAYSIHILQTSHIIKQKCQKEIIILFYLKKEEKQKQNNVLSK